MTMGMGLELNTIHSCHAGEGSQDGRQPVSIAKRRVPLISDAHPG